jgi:hypothetical protein
VGRGKFVIRNKSDFDTEEVKKLVRFACQELDMSEVLCEVKNTSHPYAGRAYNCVPHHMKPWPAGSFYAMKLRVGTKVATWPHWYHGYEEDRKNPEWPLWELRSWQETLVMLAAHEAYHISLYKNGTRPRHRELACEKFASYMLDLYRQA